MPTLGLNTDRDMFANTDHSCSCALRFCACHWFNLHSDGKAMIVKRPILSCCLKCMNSKLFKMPGRTCRNLFQRVVGGQLEISYNLQSLFTTSVQVLRQTRIWGRAHSRQCRMRDIAQAMEAVIPRSKDFQCNMLLLNDDAIKLKHFPRHWPCVRGFHPSPVNPPHKGQWRGALMFSLIWAWTCWTNGWENNQDAGHLRRHRAHYDVTGGMLISAYQY